MQPTVQIPLVSLFEFTHFSKILLTHDAFPFPWAQRLQDCFQILQGMLPSLSRALGPTSRSRCVEFCRLRGRRKGSAFHGTAGVSYQQTS